MKAPVEIPCIICDGAGTQPDKGAQFGIRVCPGCNGHGRILFDENQTVIKFDVDQRQTKVAVIDGTDNTK